MSIKKILSLILAISMLMTSFAVVYADEAEEAAAEETVSGIVTEADPYYRAVKVLEALGIMRGKSETDFGANDTLTRAEMSTIAVRFIGLDSDSTGVADSGFDDVDDEHWAKYYIDMATGLGIVNGNGDGSFEPDGEVTAEQAVKIMVCAMGYEPKAQTLGQYPQAYLTVASSLGLFAGIDFSDGYSNPMSRWQIAMLVYNALEADLMDVIVYGANNYSKVTEDMTALEVYHNAVKETGTVTATDVSSFDDGYRVMGEVAIDDVEYVTELDMAEMLGQYVDFYYIKANGSAKSEIIAAFPIAGRSDRIEIDFDDVKTVSVNGDFRIEIEYYTEDGAKTKNISTVNPIIMYNGKKVEFATATEAQDFLDANMNQGQLAFLKNTKSGFSDVMFVENYNAYVVSSADSASKKIHYRVYEVGKTNTAVLDLSQNDDPNRKISIRDENGEAIEISDLAANDVIMVYESIDKSICKIYRSRKQVSGKITRMDVVPGTATGDSGKLPTYWEELNTITMDDFNAPANDSYATSSLNRSGTYKGRDIYLHSEAGTFYDIMKTDKNYKRMGHRTGFVDKNGYVNIQGFASQEAAPTGAYDYSYPTDLPTSDTKRVYELSRDEVSNWMLWNPWSPWNGKIATWIGAGYGAPDSYIMVGNIFDENKVNTGDKLKITAWVYAHDMRTMPAAKEPGAAYAVPEATTATEAPIQMWISESNAMDGNWQSGSDKNYNQNVPDETKPEEIYRGTIKADEWKKLELEYELNGTNISVSSIQINNDTVNHDATVYPLRLAIAGVKVERFVDPNLVNGRPQIYVDKTQYDVFVDGTEYKGVSNFPTSLLESGKNVTLLIDGKGRIAGYLPGLEKTGYALLMDVGVLYGAFGNTLQVKLLENDNTLKTYETTEEVKAYNGTEVVKMPAAQLVTNEPADPKTDWHLWSTNNASNFEAVARTYTTEEAKSKAASRKIVYYETNAKGEIKTILVPSMPEDHKEAKIVMIKDFEYDDSGTGQLFHSAWPKFLTHSSAIGRAEPVYRISDDLIKYFVWANEYSEDDYETYSGDMWRDNVTRGYAWHYAQLYRVPGSKTVDFMIMNGDVRANTEGYGEFLYVKNIEKTEDGYTITGYDPNVNAARGGNHLWTYKLKKDLRLFENIWMTAPDSSGVRLTWDNIADYAGTLPYCVSYEALGMETPYVDETSLEPGDFVRIVVTDNEVTYLEVMRRKSIALPSMYSTIGKGDLDGFFSKGYGYANGVISEINYEEGFVKIDGFYWPSASERVTEKLYTQAANDKNNYITEMKVTFVPGSYTTVWDEERNTYSSGTFNDYQVGDLIFIWDRLNYSRHVMIYKNHK